MTDLPSPERLFTVIAATWPAARTQACGPFTLREGRGAGSRVSAATLNGSATTAEIEAAVGVMRDMGQPALFQVREGQEVFDRQLVELGFVLRDRTNFYAAPVASLTLRRPPAITSFEVWPPLEVQREIWAAGQIGPERMAVMARAQVAKMSFLGRVGERPAGTAYAGIAEDCAMLHALEIASHARRQGLARHLTTGAAFWAKGRGAEFLTLVTTEANIAANALYASLGMTHVGQYHYRILQEPPQ